MKKLTTHCNRNHELTIENTYVSPKTKQRMCRVCRSLNQKNLASTSGYKKYQSDWAKRNRDRLGRMIRRWELKNLYNITPEQYYLLKKEQNDVCAICKKPETSVDRRRGKVRDLSVDHVHDETKTVRGLLCHFCNNAIGLLKDNPDFCIAAAEYLKNPPAKRFLNDAS